MRFKPCFKPFSKAELRFVASLKSDHLRAQAGETIVTADKAKARIYTLWEGWAFRYRSLSDGSRQILDFLLPGDLIGLDGWPNKGVNAYSVEALTPVSLCVLEGRSLADLVRRHPELAIWLLDRGLAEGRSFGSTALSLGRRPAPERLAWLMLDTFDRLAARGMVNGNSCSFPLQRRHLADALGLSGTHVTRALAQLQKKGVADIAASTLVIVDRSGLAQLASYSSWSSAPVLLL